MLKVFLVEDECVVREGLRECIDWARYGFEFCGDAPDGELALPQIRKLRPDILITDIKMPFMDGLALSKLVCAELPETKIILISGHNDFEFAQEAIEIGVEQYLLKPVTKSSLLKTLEDVSRKIDEEREQKAYLRRFQQEGRAERGKAPARRPSAQRHHRRIAQADLPLLRQPCDRRYPPGRLGIADGPHHGAAAG